MCTTICVVSTATEKISEFEKPEDSALMKTKPPTGQDSEFPYMKTHFPDMTSYCTVLTDDT
jgi:hypothetical protein